MNKENSNRLILVLIIAVMAGITFLAVKATSVIPIGYWGILLLAVHFLYILPSMGSAYSNLFAIDLGWKRFVPYLNERTMFQGSYRIMYDIVVLLLILVGSFALLAGFDIIALSVIFGESADRVMLNTLFSMILLLLALNITQGFAYLNIRKKAEEEQRRVIGTGISVGYLGSEIIYCLFLFLFPFQILGVIHLRSHLLRIGNVKDIVPKEQFREV